MVLIFQGIFAHSAINIGPNFKIADKTIYPFLKWNIWIVPAFNNINDFVTDCKGKHA